MVVLQLAYRSERVGRIADAVASYEELVGLGHPNPEAIDRLAHLKFLQGKKGAGRELAQACRSPGLHDGVCRMAERIHDKGTPTARPPHTMPEHLVQFPDLPWSGH